MVRRRLWSNCNDVTRAASRREFDMTTELRNRFDQTLQAALQALSFEGLTFKTGKRKLRVSAQGEAVAELSFIHLGRADGVHLLARVFDGATCRALKALDLAPLNIVLSQDMLLISSLSEDAKQFGDEIGGSVRLYPAMDLQATCATLVDKLKAFHLRRIADFLSLAPRLPDDILRYPADYAFPAATAALAFKAQGREAEFADFVVRAKAKKFWGFTQASIVQARERVFGSAG
jgi:hypothetical protein